MKIEELKYCIKLCKKIGLKTFVDLDNFYKKEKLDNETIKVTLERYANELGEDFKIKEEDIENN